MKPMKTGATKLAILVLCSLLVAACGDASKAEGDREKTIAADEPTEAPPTATEEDGDDPLADLSKPVVPPAPKNEMDAWFGATVETLMVEGVEAIDTRVMTRRVLRFLEAENLLSRGRPEGVVRDLLLRMKEDVIALTPPDFSAADIDDFRRNTIRLLGKSYADDLRRKLSPKGAGGVHEGTLRQVPVIPKEALKPGFEVVTWKRLGGWVFDKKTKVLREDVKKLNGKEVAIAGFLMPTAEFDDIREFLLVDSLWTCCFGEPAAVNQVVIVKMAPGKPGIPFYQDPIVVHGVLDVGVEEDEGWVTSVYRLEASDVATLKRR